MIRIALFIFFILYSTLLVADGCSSVSFTATATPNLACSIDFQGLSVQNTDCDYSQPYDYYWDFGDGSPLVYTTMNPSHEYQASGVYSVTFTWEGICHGAPTVCFTTQDVMITLPPPPPITSIISDYNGYNVSCYGGNDGAITLSSIGSYTFEWQTSPIQYGNTINNLYGGPIEVLALLDGCPSQPISWNLSQPNEITSNISSNADYNGYDLRCFGDDDASINLSVNGGVPSYSYLWDNDDTTTSLDNLSAGYYTVIITDLNDCVHNDIIELTQPNVISSNITSNASYNGYDLRCFGDDDASINLTVNGGVPSYSYLWDNGSTTEDLTDLSAGSYIVTITDLNNCIHNDTIELIEPDILESTIISIQDTCGKGVGTAEINVSGGIEQYEYLWSNNENNQLITNLYEGNYNVIVTDANQCLISEQAIITNLPPPISDFIIIPSLALHHFAEQFNNPIMFFNNSQDEFNPVDQWVWEFEDGYTATTENTEHSFDAIGSYEITLFITSEFGCIDSITKKVIIEDFILYIPNSFTPNGDEINDIFLPKGMGVLEYQLDIYNRWGGFVNTSKHLTGNEKYHANNSNEAIGWDGTYKNSNKIAQLGVYIYKINLTDVFGMPHQYIGEVNLIK